MSSTFSIKAENSTYWSNKLYASLETMTLTVDKTAIFEFFNTGTGGKYIASYTPGVYLRWDQIGQSLVIRPSSIPLSTPWSNVPPNDKPNLTFTYVTVDNDLKFQLQPGYRSKQTATSLYFRRVRYGQVDYIVAQNENDIFTHFTKSYA